MRFHPSFIVFITIIHSMCTSALNNENKTGFDIIDILTYETKLKSEYGCNPPDEWNLLKYNSKNGFVRDVCISRSYQISEPPNVGQPTPIAFAYSKNRVLNINEREKSITLMIETHIAWEDSRIRAKANRLKPPIQLPAISKTKQDIWFPLKFPTIENVKEIRSLLDPIIAEDVYLYLGKDVNRLIHEEKFPQNSTIIGASPIWKLQFFCPFHFDRYPFDQQDCSFKLKIKDIDITLLNFSATREVEDYELKLESKSYKPTYDELHQRHVTAIGMSIKMKRKMTPHIYRYYLPCGIIVFMSFFSLMIPLTAIPGRVSMVVTLFLTITNIFIHHMVRIPCILH